jgi:hypothetical protein
VVDVALVDVGLQGGVRARDQIGALNTYHFPSIWRNSPFRIDRRSVWVRERKD